MSPDLLNLANRINSPSAKGISVSQQRPPGAHGSLTGLRRLCVVGGGRVAEEMDLTKSGQTSFPNDMDWVRAESLATRVFSRSVMSDSKMFL